MMTARTKQWNERIVGAVSLTSETKAKATAEEPAGRTEDEEKPNAEPNADSAAA